MILSLKLTLLLLLELLRRLVELLLVLAVLEKLFLFLRRPVLGGGLVSLAVTRHMVRSSLVGDKGVLLVLR